MTASLGTDGFFTQALGERDPEIFAAIGAELGRQRDEIELIASENFASDAVMKLCGSEFTNKYAEGYPGRRYYNGCEHMDEIETLAIDTLKEIYGCKYANVQPHSGANANLAIMKAFLNVGDTILGMDLASGGHLTHGAPVTISGKWFDSHTYGVGEDGLINYDDVALMAQQAKDMTINAEKPDKDIFKLLWNDLFGLPLRRTELTGAEGEALKILFDNSFGGNDATR